MRIFIVLVLILATQYSFAMQSFEEVTVVGEAQVTDSFQYSSDNSAGVQQIRIRAIMAAHRAARQLCQSQTTLTCDIVNTPTDNECHKIAVDVVEHTLTFTCSARAFASNARSVRYHRNR